MKVNFLYTPIQTQKHYHFNIEELESDLERAKLERDVLEFANKKLKEENERLKKELNRLLCLNDDIK